MLSNRILDMPKNPYPKGSARAKLWARREADKKKKKTKKKVKKKTDKTKRRSYLDKKIDSMS